MKEKEYLFVSWNTFFIIPRQQRSEPSLIWAGFSTYPVEQKKKNEASSNENIWFEFTVQKTFNFESVVVEKLKRQEKVRVASALMYSSKSAVSTRDVKTTFWVFVCGYFYKLYIARTSRKPSVLPRGQFKSTLDSVERLPLSKVAVLKRKKYLYCARARVNKQHRALGGSESTIIEQKLMKRSGVIYLLHLSHKFWSYFTVPVPKLIIRLITFLQSSPFFPNDRFAAIGQQVMVV